MASIGVLQMVDTLEAGGAERVAVNLANSLPSDQYRSFLCTTRREGPLAGLVAPQVGRLELSRRRSVDLPALSRLARFVREHGIRILHAHGSALYFARLAAMFPPYPKVIWHAHYGKLASEDQPGRLFRMASFGIGAVIAVNQPLALWAHRRLGVPAARIRYVPNLVCETPAEPPRAIEAPEDLPGLAGYRIVCVGNLRPEKDHPTLIRAMHAVVREIPRAHLLLVGAETDLSTAAQTREEIENLSLGSRVTLLGARNDIPSILRVCDVGVLSSVSEGLPMALLEYGQAGLATVATDVGQCLETLDSGRAGLVVPPGAPAPLAEALIRLLRSPQLRTRLGNRFRQRVETFYGPGPVMQEICRIYRFVLAG